MKKILYLTVVVLLGACSHQMTPLPTGEQLRTCLSKEALTRVQDGSALASPIRTTAKKMLNACQPQKEQIPENVALAQTILRAMMQEKQAQ